MTTCYKRVPLPDKLVDAVKQYVHDTETVQGFVARATLELLKQELANIKECEAEIPKPRTLARHTRDDARLVFAKELNYLRKAKGLKRKKLAKISGIHYQSILEYERGETLPSDKNMKILGYMLTGDINYFIHLNKKLDRRRKKLKGKEFEDKYRDIPL